MSEPHVALYRKYRPQSFEDVVGQEHIVTLLTSAIKQGKISHAYLFSGGRGTGKTTVARIFARAVGCNDEDIIEIDAASNRGIDEIRELREAVRTAPFSSPYKVYIIDEAHMLTKEASNALLKTLEEPPHHVIFILATTDPHKLPDTIISRCQNLSFSSPQLTVLAGRLLHVAKSEGKVLDEKTAELIASFGKGSYRDALSVLEKVFTVGKNTITYEQVQEMLGSTEEELILNLLASLCSQQSDTITRTLQELRKKDTNPVRLYDECVEAVRVGLRARVLTGGKDDSDSPFSKKLAVLAKENPHFFSSKVLLFLLEKKPLLEVSPYMAWTAFEAVVISLFEEHNRA